MERTTGRRYKTCPAGGLDEFHRKHRDTDGPCSMFRCRTCVADPEDLGRHDPDEVPMRPSREARNWEIPF